MIEHLLIVALLLTLAFSIHQWRFQKWRAGLWESHASGAVGKAIADMNGSRDMFTSALSAHQVQEFMRSLSE